MFQCFLQEIYKMKREQIVNIIRPLINSPSMRTLPGSKIPNT